MVLQINDSFPSRFRSCHFASLPFIFQVSHLLIVRLVNTLVCYCIYSLFYGINSVYALVCQAPIAQFFIDSLHFVSFTFHFGNAFKNSRKPNQHPHPLAPLNLVHLMMYAAPKEEAGYLAGHSDSRLS